ncbi:MAG TPA: (2Fe-2S) ferredoxin domain-containing protein [Candidatus Omnitrophota bacterium]|nr:(2Fe-2S) ferredoxin domain-containing protein [Candidatus Omnitrophota bacterium]HOX09705.1 (2Fe-2S) ferredoxin domain-containing protein [Candidatus Omnitrophota bacterium]HRZ66900.1 (2Fe-2S) ferredoxin domain-containing protein [Candidatus Omnitrophota bacterium]
MSKITRESLENIAKQKKPEDKNWIKVGMSSCGIAAGADKVFDVLTEEAKKRNINVIVKKCGCVGMCSVEPLVEVNVEGMPQVTYGKVNGEVAVQILEEHIHSHRLVNDHIYDIQVKK